MDNEEIYNLTEAVRSIAHGKSQPSGLELVSMSIAKSDEPSLAYSVSEVAEAMEGIALALNNIATAIEATQEK